MNDPCFAMSIYEEAGDVYFKGHRNQMASLPFFRVPVVNYSFFVDILMLNYNFPFGSNKKLYKFVSSLLHHSFCAVRCALPGWQSAVCKEHQGRPFRIQILK